MSRSPTFTVLSILTTVTTTVFALMFQFDASHASTSGVFVSAAGLHAGIAFMIMAAGFPIAFILAVIAAWREERWQPMAVAVVALVICLVNWARTNQISPPPEPRVARVVRQLPLYSDGFSVLADGRLLLWSTYQFSLLSPDGSYAEGTLGPSRLDPFPPQTAIGPDGSVFKTAVGEFVRYTASGKIDPSFRYDGKLPEGRDITERRMAVGSDGSLFVSDPLGRLKPDGSVDDEFRPPDRDTAYEMDVTRLLPLPGNRLAVAYRRRERTDLESWVTTETFLDVLDPGGRRQGTLHLPGIVWAAAVTPAGDLLYLGAFQDLIQVSLRNRPQVLRRRRIGQVRERGPFDLAVANDGKVLLRMESELRRYTAGLVEEKGAVRWTPPLDQDMGSHGLAFQGDRILILNGGIVARLLPNGAVDPSFRLPTFAITYEQYQGGIENPIHRSLTAAPQH